MNNVIGMEYNQSVQNASKNHGSILFFEITSFLDLVKKFLPIQMLQNQMNVIIGFKDLI